MPLGFKRKTHKRIIILRRNHASHAVDIIVSYIESISIVTHTNTQQTEYNK